MTLSFAEVIIKLAIILFVVWMMMNFLVGLEGRLLTLMRPGSYPSGHFGSKFAGPFLLFIKSCFKEESSVISSSTFYYRLAPALSFVIMLLPITTLPFCQNFYIGNTKFTSEIFPFQYGLLFAYATTSLFYFSSLLAAFPDTNLLSRIGGLRIYYHKMAADLLILFAMLAVFLQHGVLDVYSLVQNQGRFNNHLLPSWNLFRQPLGAMVFFLAAMIKSGRAPFNLANSDSELGQSYKNIFSAFRFYLLWVAENVHFLVICLIGVYLYFGGYSLLPGLDWLAEKIDYSFFFLQCLSLTVKLAMVITFLVWLGHSLPRFK
ncbi:MAG: NADH-quinone oxidoreductase subunit H, partial [Pseudomonadota bacterium]